MHADLQVREPIFCAFLISKWDAAHSWPITLCCPADTSAISLHICRGDLNVAVQVYCHDWIPFERKIMTEALVAYASSGDDTDKAGNYPFHLLELLSY